MKGAAAFIFAGIVLAQVAAAVKDYGDDRAEATAIRHELGATALASAVAMSQSLHLTIDNALPNAQVVTRCSTDTLPGWVAANGDEVCPDAALGEMLEEQEEGNHFRQLGFESRAFVDRLRYQLEDDQPSRQWDSVVSGFRDLGRLGNSDTCGEDRIRRAETLRQPREGEPIIGRGSVLDEPLLVTAERYELTQTELDRLQLLPDDPTTVRDALVGPTTSTERCDLEGADLARFMLAATATREMLVDEAGLLASAVQEVNVEGVNDTGFDVFSSLWTWPFAIALALGLALWIGAQFISEPERVTKVSIVSDESGQN